MWVPCASSWPDGQMPCSNSAPGTPRPPGRDVASPESGRAHAQARLSHPGLAWSGATATHVWHLMDFVDAAAVPEFTPVRR